MAKVNCEGKFPKRIENLVLYQLDDQIILRRISGFTSKALHTSPKYDLSRRNASEFGRVSSICKAFRVALRDYLPKKNNLLVVNALTKKMRQVLNFDTVSVRGERILKYAIANKKGRDLLNGYHFNPAASSLLTCVQKKKQLQVGCEGVVFPDGANSVGFTVVTLAFDFETADFQLIEGVRQFYDEAHLPHLINLEVPGLLDFTGNLFTILTVTFYTEAQGSYVPVLDDSSKVVLVVG